MKYLFLSILIIVAPIVATAQKFEIGLSGGIAHNDALKVQSPYTVIMGQPAPLRNAPVCAVKGMYTTRTWQVGMTVEYREMSYRSGNYFGTISHGIPYDPTPAELKAFWDMVENARYITITQDRQYYPIKFFVNRKISIKKFEVYGGAALGYIFIPHLPGSFSNVLKLRSPFNKMGYHGMTAGAQVGATYFINKQVGFNMELAAEYTRFRQGDAGVFYTWCIPATVGIRYKL